MGFRRHFHNSRIGDSVFIRSYNVNVDCRANQLNSIYDATVPLGPGCTPGKDNLDNDISYTIFSLGVNSSECSSVSDSSL